MKPAFIFDGRNVLDHARLREIGFVVYALGKPLDPFLTQVLGCGAHGERSAGAAGGGARGGWRA